MIDIERIKAANPIAEVIGRSVALKKRGHEYVALCPFRSEKTPSFTVVPEKGFFKCFGCGEQGDVIDFIRKLHNIDLKRACEMLGGGGELYVNGSGHERPQSRPAPEWQPIMPVPGDAPAPPDVHPQLGAPEHVSRILNQAGKLLYLICRWPPINGRHKAIRPLCFDGSAWQWKGPPVPRPLYGLPLNRLPVLIVEGEKKRDAAALVLDGIYDVVSWPNGSQAFAEADWSPLRGLDAIIWPDADDPGAHAGSRLPERLRGVVASVRLLCPPPAVAPGWDVADAIAEGWSAEDLARYIDAGVRVRDPNPEQPEPDPDDPGPPPTDPSIAPDHPPRAAHRGGDGAISWVDPVDFLTDAALGVPELRPNHIPEALWGFVRDVSVRMGVDPVSVALGCLVCCASVISDEWKLQPRRHDFRWTESPRLWAGILGGPSTIKTPQIAACSRPIEELEAEARKRHAEEMSAYKAAMAEHKQALKNKEESEEPRHPKLDRYLIEGTTVEALQEVLRNDDGAKQRAPARKVLSRHDEMSEWFASLDRYKSGGNGGGDRGSYLRLYNGGRYTLDRVGRGSFAVPNWSACFLGGCQPGPIQKIAREAADDGLLQRFMWCVPERQSPGVDQRPDLEAEKRYEDLFPALLALTPAPDHPGSNYVRPVVLHADGHALREEIESMARAMAAMPDASLRLQSTFGKWGGLFARLVLTFHMINIADARCRGIQPSPLAVAPLSTITMVSAFMQDIVLPHLLRADALMFSTSQSSHARWIAGLILARKFERITTRDITRAYSAMRAPEAARELAEVMSSLVAVGWLEPEESQNQAKPTHAWLVNPAVHTVFAARAAQEQAARQQTNELAANDIRSLLKKRKGIESQNAP